MSNRWQLHVKEWKNCTRCDLHKTRENVVLLRGDVPCDVLFVGEAPGHSEDSFGVPMVGQAGILFQEDIVKESIPDTITYAVTNLIACIPLGEDGKKTVEPPEEAVYACKDRLIDLCNFAKPKLIVMVGKHAEHYLNPKYLKRIKIPDDIPRIAIKHPSWIQRLEVNKQPSEINKCVVDIRTAIKKHIPKGMKG